MLVVKSIIVLLFFFCSAKKQGLEGVSPDVSRIVSHATEYMLRDMISKLSNVAEHRMENYRMEPHYEMTSDVRLQLKFLEELNKLEKKRHEDQEREILLRAIKVGKIESVPFSSLFSPICLSINFFPINYAC